LVSSTIVLRTFFRGLGIAPAYVNKPTVRIRICNPFPRRERF
jgi:hypothetical protein